MCGVQWWIRDNRRSAGAADLGEGGTASKAEKGDGGVLSLCGFGWMPAAFQLGHTGCVARGDVAVEGRAEFGEGDPREGAQAMHFEKKGQPGLQLIQKAGVHRLGKTKSASRRIWESVTRG